jgi:hypothetical protein
MRFVLARRTKADLIARADSAKSIAITSVHAAAPPARGGWRPVRSNGRFEPRGSRQTRHTVLRTLFVLSITSTPLLAQQLDDAAVSAALQAGASKKYYEMVSTCIASPGFGAGLGASMAGGVQPIGDFDVVTTAAAGRIAFLAAEGKRLYKPFTATDVTAELRNEDTAFVIVNPKTPRMNQKTYEVPSLIERVVLKSKTDPNRVAQPTNVDLVPQEWSNLMGGKIEGNSAVATFAVSDVKELPPGDVDVVIITRDGERRCKINTKDRTKLFKQPASVVR